MFLFENWKLNGISYNINAALKTFLIYIFWENQIVCSYRTGWRKQEEYSHPHPSPQKKKKNK